MKFDFTKIVLKDIDGKILKMDMPFHKVIANTLYSKAKTLDLVETARTINKGMPCEMTKDEIAEFIAIVNEQNFPHAFVRKSILDYIESVKK